jgi:hypothetical protein
MTATLEMPPGSASPKLRELLGELVSVQDEHRHGRRGTVRTIWSKETLLAEYAVGCLLGSEDSSHWGYQVARHYAERYDPSFGTGLIPQSAPVVDDIVGFLLGNFQKASIRLR